MDSFPGTIRYLYSLGNEIKSLKFGLEAITVILKALGDPHNSFESVHIAGTNGKGSTAAMIESVLRETGRRTGLYTSPHLVDPTERIAMAGSPVTRVQFVQAFDRVHAVAEKLLSQGKLEHHPTYFETVTAMAFLLFQEAKIQTAVLEVGMGGRLDATNVVAPQVSVITPIDLDHQQWLGNTIEEIAREKAGILKPSTPCVFAPQRPEAARVLEQQAELLDCSVTRADELPVTAKSVQPYSSSFQLDGQTLICPLAGEHQLNNALTAVTALKVLDVPTAKIRDGLANTIWPGRLEKIREHPEILLDGAHNPAGARVLADYLLRFHSGRRIRLIFGAMRDKAVSEVAATLFPLAESVILTAPQSERAADPEQILGSVQHTSLRNASSATDAISLAMDESSPRDLIVVTGSLYLVGEVRALLVE